MELSELINQLIDPSLDINLNNDVLVCIKNKESGNMVFGKPEFVYMNGIKEVCISCVDDTENSPLNEINDVDDGK